MVIHDMWKMRPDNELTLKGYFLYDGPQRALHEDKLTVRQGESKLLSLSLTKDTDGAGLISRLARSVLQMCFFLTRLFLQRALSGR